MKSSCKSAVLVVEGALRVARASATSLSVATLLRVALLALWVPLLALWVALWVPLLWIALWVALLIAVLMVALLRTCLVVALPAVAALHRPPLRKCLTVNKLRSTVRRVDCNLQQFAVTGVN